MKFKVYYSSSKGNLYEVVANDGQRLLLECGVRFRTLQKALDHDLTGIVGCLITHEHKDHSKAASEVRQAGIDLYASAGTLGRIGFDLSERRVYAVSHKTLIRTMEPFEVFCFNVNHDAAEPMGYVIREKATNEFMLFVTDTSHIEQRFTYPFSIIAIECSYDYQILSTQRELGDIHEALAIRLLTSHMEKDTTLRYLKRFCDLSKCTEIHLLHMSGDRIDKKKTRKEFEEQLFIKVL